MRFSCWLSLGLSAALLVCGAGGLAQDADGSDRPGGARFLTDTPISLARNEIIAAAVTHSFAEYSGRSLGGETLVIGVRPGSRAQAWAAWSRPVVKGRNSENRFDSSSVRLGARIVLRGEEERGLALQYDGWFASTGTAYTVGSKPGEYSSAVFPGPEAHVLTMVNDTGPVWDMLERSTLAPTYRMKALLSLVRGTRRTAYGVGVGGGAAVSFTPRLSASIEATALLEGTEDTQSESGRSAKALIAAGMEWRCARWLRIEASGELCPWGLPYAGSSMSGLSGFLMYAPGSAAELRRSAVALGAIKLVVGTAF